MKTVLSLITLMSIFCSPAFSRIVYNQDSMFLVNNGNRIPMETVNRLIKKKAISKIKLFNEGHARIIAFKKKGGPEKLYSVDEKGFIYSINPFTDYTVKEVDDNGMISFAEVPNRKYKVSSQGFFLY